MTYGFNNEEYKIVKVSNVHFKLYHIIINKWSKGLTFIGDFSSIETAKSAAAKYCA